MAAMDRTWKFDTKSNEQSNLQSALSQGLEPLTKITPPFNITTEVLPSTYVGRQYLIRRHSNRDDIRGLATWLRFLLIGRQMPPARW